jgi:ATP-dependent helicase/nuclease subunit A
MTAEEAVRRAARQTGLVDHLTEAVADVERSVAALHNEGLTSGECAIEYPLAGSWYGGLLLSGYIDLVVADSGQLSVIDFKTDAPPVGGVNETYPEYARQVKTYGRVLRTAGVVGGQHLRCGLLFTADGVIRWVGGE